MKEARTKSISLLFLAFVASAAMLTVIQPPFSLSFLAWVSLVPFILGAIATTTPASTGVNLSPRRRGAAVQKSNGNVDSRFRGNDTGRVALVAYIISLFYWLGNLYWMAPITILGWLVFCFYTALLWPFVAFSLRYCRGKKIPLFLAAGVLVVGAERLQGFFLGGFFWRFLAHSQYQNITLIQTADIFGVAGLSFLIAMVNGLLAELIISAREKHIFKISNLIKTAVVFAALVATIVYGRWRMDQSPQFITQGPLVASLQSNVPQSVKRTFSESDKMFEDLMQQSRAAAKTGAELIVWPETMVQAVLNPRVVALLDPSYPYSKLDKALKEFSKDTAYVLVGAYGGTLQLNEDSMLYLVERYNSAFLYKSDGRQSDKHYDKIHLVPFGEFLPFKKKFPALYNFLMKFTPYNYDYSLDAGSEYTIFEMSGREGRVYRFGVMICYEDTVPKIARGFVLNQAGQKQADWLVNISNDGWFVKFKDGRVIPNTELPQHAAICAFRAVENRVSVLRSVNTGISCLIDSLGRIHNGYIAASQEFPAEAMRREGIAGWFTDKMPIDTRVAFFSKYGQWLDFCCAICFVLLIMAQLSAKFLTRGERSRTKDKKTYLSERTNEKLNNKS